MLKINSDMKIKSIDKRVFFAFLLIAAITVSMLPPLALAQIGIPQPEKTGGYISVAPTLIGVGQNATVNLWVYPLPQNYLYRAYYGGFHGVTVTFVKPDGSKDTFMPVDGTGTLVAGQTESLGAIFFYYEPDMAGNWSVTMSMPAQNITDSTGTVQYTACTSDPAYFTVQTDPVLAGLLNGYPWSPLPDENTFWSYPINSNNREWSQISGDWLQGGFGAYVTIGSIWGTTCRLWQPYGTAPNTAHIVWKQPLKAGGIIGGDYGSLSDTTPFEQRGVIIMEGKVFQNIPNTAQFQCIDETTGEVLYTASGQISCGIHIPGNAQLQSFFDSSVVLASSAGSTPTSYLFGTSGTTWNYYDPFTGRLLQSIANCSSNFRIIDGTTLAYATAGGNLTAVDLARFIGSRDPFLPSGGPNNWPTGITWTRPLPTSLLGSSPALFAISTDLSTIVCRTTNQYWGFSAKDGTSLWNTTITYPVVGNEAIDLYGVDDFIIFNGVDTTFHCYSKKTGAELWTSDSFADSTWASQWTVYGAETNDLNNLYLQFPDGTMTALSLNNGETLWRSKAFASTEYTNNAVPYIMEMILAGGNLYAYAGYSVGYQINPIPRQAMMVCVNATTGDNTWTLNGGVYAQAVANGYIIGWGVYDGNTYCLGKGKTSTSVAIQNNVVAQGGTILIQGNVLDQSPAQPGTPAVSDDSMSEWMDYLNMQNATLLNSPPTPKGVQVTLTAVDPNNNPITIGTTTTNAAGNFYYSYVPPQTGIYKITATFTGSNSYFSSSSETGVTVTEVPSTTATPVSNLATATDVSSILTYLAFGIVAIIIAIAIVGMLLLRKK